MDEENFFNVSEGTEYIGQENYKKKELADVLNNEEDNSIFEYGNQPYREEFKISKEHIEYEGKKR